MDESAIHTVPAAGGWENRRAGSTEPLSWHQRKMDAVDAGRALARSAATTLVVHSRDGSVRASIDCRSRRGGSLRI